MLKNQNNILYNFNHNIDIDNDTIFRNFLCFLDLKQEKSYFPYY